eukprot:GGOE01002565.1.p2 GENE.GGOE01002565.1~~GGOE01002565.1.p2  ORF type:complete len:231 (-),score=70.47 GGOE01002565.1:234-926(-)
MGSKELPTSGGGSLRLAFLISAFLAALVGMTHLLAGPAPRPLPRFRGPRWRTPQTLQARVVYDSAREQVEEHTVRTEDNRTVSGWVWNNYPDQVNVLVEKDGSFLVFRQRKYGLERESLAVVGGMIEAGESPEQAAQRELLEEMGLETPELVPLGRYRTDVNRGMGWCSCFLARRCVPSAQRRPSDDLERQTLQWLSRRELRAELLRGGFAEVKWAATVALSLLTIDGGG